MTIAAGVVPGKIAWWREPTKDQWLAWIAAWLGWMLDAFDFTIFFLIMVPISQEFGVPLTLVAGTVTLTLWLRLVGAVASGWLCDRIGRKTPLMLSILWYSICNFAAGFSPSFAFLAFFRIALGIGMGAEWPAGAALAMEAWPARSRGIMSGLLQGSWGLGFLLASLAYGFLFNSIGWRGMLWLGILPALVCVYIRFFVKESEIWMENKRQQGQRNQEVRGPLLAIFKRNLLRNTLTACLWMSGQFLVYYSMIAMFASWLQKDLKFTASAVALPNAMHNLVAFLAMGMWGLASDRIGRRWAIIIPAVIGCFIAPFYLNTTDLTWITIGFAVQGAFAGAIYGMQPAYLTERFPTEVRATASAFCYHFGAILGGIVPPLITYLAVNQKLGFPTPMLYGTVLGATMAIVALLFSPETKGTVFKSDLQLR
jgi:MFS transporter, SHS family, lactate transporter